MTDEQKITSETWREVGDQFRALGESLATAFRTTWESEENRQHLQEMRSGLETMVNEIAQAIQEASATPEAQKVRGEVERAAESARAAGEQAWKDARPHLLSALRQVNAEVQKMVSRMEQREPDPEAAVAEANSTPPPSPHPPPE
jgi:phage-related minor tail protein